MTSEAGRFLAKARQCLADAVLYQPLVSRIAGREAYLAAFHAAEALLYKRTGKLAKTHRGLRAQFARIAKDEPPPHHPSAYAAGSAVRNPLTHRRYNGDLAARHTERSQ